MAKQAKIVIKKNTCYQAINISKIIDADGNEYTPEGEVSLCNCGASKNLPFCDGSHDNGEKQMGDNEEMQIIKHVGEVTEPMIVIAKGGPLHLKGNIEIETDKNLKVSEDHVSTLCRCGESKTKPFCDGSHQHCRFDRYDE